MLYIINKLNPSTETTWDDVDWKIDGVKTEGGTEYVKIVSVHDMAVQIKTNDVVGSYDYLDLEYSSGYSYTSRFTEKLTILFSDPISYMFANCHGKRDFPTANFPTDVQKIWSISLTNEPDIVITVDVNEVRVAEMSDEFCDMEDWKDNWKNFDFKEAEISIYSSAEDMVDGYKVVVKEGNYMNYFKLKISSLCSSLPWSNWFI